MPELEKQFVARWRFMLPFSPRSLTTWHHPSIKRLGLAVLCLSLAFLTGCQEENAKWTFAHAVNLADEGQCEQAIEFLESALEQSPDSVETKLFLAKLLAQNGRGDLAIGHCDDVLNKFPDSVTARKTLSTCQMYRGRYDQSLAEYKTCLSGSVSRSISQKNRLAYLRGLANQDLDRAMQEISEAIEMETKTPWGGFYSAPLRVRVAVSAGLVSRFVGEHNSALCAINKKIDQYEKGLSLYDTILKSEITDKIQTEFPLSERTEERLIPIRIQQQRHKDCLIMMYAVRALVLEDLGRYSDVDRDRERVAKLGFDFDKIASQLPDEYSCLDLLDRSFWLLDTRGFLNGIREWKPDGDISLPVLGGQEPASYSQALKDLDLAILGAKIHFHSLNSELYNRPGETMREILIKRRNRKRMMATLYYHRMNTHLRGGNKQAAKLDEQSVEKLGQEPDSRLF